MRNQENRIIYVGKARILRNRLNSYFNRNKDLKTTILMGQVKSIETIIAANEYDALLLENTLIKQHSPKYNINLKDGKTYPVIRITAEDFPRVFRTRHVVQDGSRYFGPFPNIPAVDTLMELTNKIFTLRKCRSPWNRVKNRNSPCMYYHIGRCEAPCCGKINQENYQVQVSRVEKLLSGETDALIGELSARMREAAETLKFEKAAEFRNSIQAIKALSGEITMVDFDPHSRDYIAWASEGVFTTYSVFSMRGGKMTGRELFRTRSAADEEESLETFLAAYYTPERPPPPELYLGGASNAGASRNAAPEEAAENSEVEPPLDEPPLGQSSLTRWFQDQFKSAPALFFQPGSAARHSTILAMARQNALEDLKRRLKERGAGPALEELSRALDLKRLPERIEGFDIAQLDGTHPVASLISFFQGMPDRKNYRYFKLRTVVGVVDDFASIREAVRRRYSRLLREGRELPDLVLIDGGIGQVNSAKQVLDELGIDRDVVGLAKRDEELWLPYAKEPIRLSKRSEALKILQHVRDETHRFATSFNQKLRSKDLFFPVLESLEGIGPKRAAAIMGVFGSLEKIAAAAPEALAEQCGVPLAAAKAVRAAVKIALEDQAREQARLTGGAKRGEAMGTARKLAEELAASAALEDAQQDARDIEGANEQGGVPQAAEESPPYSGETPG